MELGRILPLFKNKKDVLTLLLRYLLTLTGPLLSVSYQEGEEGRESFPLQFPESRRWCWLCCPLLGGPGIRILNTNHLRSGVSLQTNKLVVWKKTKNLFANP